MSKSNRGFVVIQRADTGEFYTGENVKPWARHKSNAKVFRPETAVSVMVAFDAAGIATVSTAADDETLDEIAGFGEDFGL